MESIEIINEYIKKCKDNLTCMHNIKIMIQAIELIKEMELIKKDLEVLDFLKRELVIEIDRNIVRLKERKEQWSDCTCILVNKQEKELLEEWLKK